MSRRKALTYFLFSLPYLMANAVLAYALVKT